MGIVRYPLPPTPNRLSVSPVFEASFDTGASRQLVVDDVVAGLGEEVHALVRLAEVLLQGLDLDAVEVVVVLRRGPVEDGRHRVAVLRLAVRRRHQNGGGQHGQEQELVHFWKVV